jgi:hypothetical protein
MLLLGVAVACGPGGPAKNPPVLFMAPLNMETQVQLIDHDPPPY